MKVLRTFGLEPNLRAAAFYPRSWINRNFDTGEIRFDMIFGETAEKRYGAPYLLAHRGAVREPWPHGAHSTPVGCHVVC
jgi:6-hydroxynicotinate 3-monooxygenase